MHIFLLVGKCENAEKLPCRMFAYLCGWWGQACFTIVKCDLKYAALFLFYPKIKKQINK